MKHRAYRMLRVPVTAAAIIPTRAENSLYRHVCVLGGRGKIVSINKLHSSQINAILLSKLCPGRVCLRQRGVSKNSISKRKGAGRSCKFNKSLFYVGGEKW